MDLLNSIGNFERVQYLIFVGPKSVFFPGFLGILNNGNSPHKKIGFLKVAGGPRTGLINSSPPFTFSTTHAFGFKTSTMCLIAVN